MYYSNARLLIGVFLSGCFSTIAVNSFITTKQIEGMAGSIRGDVGKLEGRIGKLEGRIISLETIAEVNFKEIKKELEILVHKGK